MVDFVSVGVLAGAFNFNIVLLHFEESAGSTRVRLLHMGISRQMKSYVT